MRNNYLARFQTTDPEFYQFFKAFAEHEAVKEPEVILDEKKTLFGNFGYPSWLSGN